MFVSSTRSYIFVVREVTTVHEIFYHKCMVFLLLDFKLASELFFQLNNCFRVQIYTQQMLTHVGLSWVV